MEPLEFKPKHSYRFWLLVCWLCSWFFYRTILANRRYLEDPSSLLHNLIMLAFIAALTAFLFRLMVKRVTIDERIVIEHYLSKPIELEPEDFLTISGSVIHLKGYTIDTTQYRNGKKLLRAFEKRIAAGLLPSGGEAPEEPQEEDDGWRGRLFRWLYWLPLLIYIAASLLLGNIKGIQLPPYIDTVALLLLSAWCLGCLWFEGKQERNI